jgi:hypothetical protein
MLDQEKDLFLPLIWFAALIFNLFFIFKYASVDCSTPYIFDSSKKDNFLSESYKDYSFKLFSKCFFVGIVIGISFLAK